MQNKFVTWIEAENPTIDQVTSNAITGTASIANVTHGLLTKAWTNGTLEGMSISELSDITIWLTCQRATTGDGGMTWMTGGSELFVNTFNGAFWDVSIQGSPSNIGNQLNGSVVSAAFRRSSSSNLIEVFKNGSLLNSYSVSNGQTISARSISSTLSSIGFMSTLGISNQSLTLEEIEYLHNNGNFRLWTNV